MPTTTKPKSSKKSATARANGAKSHGPVTPEGKLASSANSLRHGILSKTIVLRDESSDDFIELLASYQAEHQPETPTEQALIENMAVARWRQERLWGMETAGLDHEIHHPNASCQVERLEGEDFPTQAFMAFRTLTDGTRALELLNRYEARYDRQFRTALAGLKSLQASRAAANPPPHANTAPTPEPGRPITLRWIAEAREPLDAAPGVGETLPPGPDSHTKIDLPNEPGEPGADTSSESATSNPAKSPIPFIPRLLALIAQTLGRTFNMSKTPACQSRGRQCKIDASGESPSKPGGAEGARGAPIAPRISQVIRTPSSHPLERHSATEDTQTLVSSTRLLTDSHAQCACPEETQ
jgi:hypothetical protein